MRILFLNQFFYPDLAATSQYLTDLTRAVGADEFASVICSDTTYAQANGDSPPPVEIIRLKALPFTRLTGRKRMASYVSFLASAAWAAFRAPKADVVVTLTTPPLTSFIGYLLQKFRGSRHVIWEMDVYPDIAFDLGILKRYTTLTRFVRHFSDQARRQADAVIALGECMKTRLLGHGIQEHRLHIVENWADGHEITPQPFPSKDKIVLHYSGNLGVPHDETTLRSVIDALANHPGFHFIVSGGGSRRADLQSHCHSRNITNVTFRPYCTRAELNRSLAEGHIGLVTQLPETLGSMVPSKTYGIMAAGRPVLYIGPRGSTPARIIENYHCGWHFENGDAEGILEFLHFLRRNPTPIHEAGARARRAFDANYDRHISIAQIAAIIGMSAALPAHTPRRRAAYASYTTALELADLPDGTHPPN